MQNQNQEKVDLLIKNKVWSFLKKMKIYIKQLEEHIQRLESQYNEPTN